MVDRRRTRWWHVVVVSRPSRVQARGWSMDDVVDHRREVMRVLAAPRSLVLLESSPASPPRPSSSWSPPALRGRRRRRRSLIVVVTHRIS